MLKSYSRKLSLLLEGHSERLMGNIQIKAYGEHGDRSAAASTPARLGCRKSIIFHNTETDMLPQDLTKTEIMKLHLNKTARLLLAKQQMKDFGQTTNDLYVIILCISAATFVKGEDFAEVALQYIKIKITPQKGCGDTTVMLGGNAPASPSPAPGAQEKPEVLRLTFPPFLLQVMLILSWINRR